MRYLTFSPYFSGFNNVVMSYEMAFALAKITNRTLVLPRNFWSPFMSAKRNDKNTWINIKEVYDKVESVYIDEVPELYGIEGGHSYTNDMAQVNDVYIYKPQKTTVSEEHVVFVNNIHEHIRSEDFLNFANNRLIVDLNRSEKFIHFENCLFGHFWYHVYPGDASARNALKSDINKIFTYKEEIFRQAAFVRQTIGSYNALHLRRNDFLSWLKDHFDATVLTSGQLLEAMKKVFPQNKQIYIATDENNYSFFDPIRKEYDICFYDDFNFQASELEKLAIEQAICFYSDYFIGTYFSTYTKRINIMRGKHKKQAMDYGGINNIHEENKVEIHKSYPWFYRPSKKWEWCDSSYLQWCEE